MSQRSGVMLDPNRQHLNRARLGLDDDDAGAGDAGAGARWRS